MPLMRDVSEMGRQQLEQYARGLQEALLPFAHAEDLAGDHACASPSKLTKKSKE
jgi:hypothetical protein